jgi:acyl-[acyl carrier protein]--UDP-N-acetylglucosamine O-acyltransferase
MRKCIGVTEAQINVRLCGKVENCVNIVSFKAVHDFGRVCDIAMVKGEISFVIEDSRVVQGSAVVELIEGNDVVGIGIGQC